VNIRRILSAAALACAIAAPAATLADPPSHAPAHGWRKKNDPYYVGYTGRQWSDDYGVRSGNCDRDRAGAAVGAVIGHEIGDNMDDKDRACFGHSLELLEDGRKVEWRGSTSDMVYALTPYGRFERDGRVCRKFTFVRLENVRRVAYEGSACRYRAGAWRMLKA
jgi:surface antigen